jgi:hypothetical protein
MVPDSPADLDPVQWESLVTLVEVAHARDGDSFATALRSFDRKYPLDGRLGAYLWYLVRYAVAQRLGRRPTEEDVDDLASSLRPFYSGLLTDDSIIAEVLAGVFEFQPMKSPSGGRLVLGGTAALAGLLEHPRAALEEMRPHLAKWWSSNEAELAVLWPPPEDR